MSYDGATRTPFTAFGNKSDSEMNEFVFLNTQFKAVSLE